MGYGTRDWALKWIEGSLLSFVENKTPLNIMVGRIRKSVESYGVKLSDLKLLMDMIEQSPIYLPSVPREEKIARLKLLRGTVETIFVTE
jgi:hypothetical protein